MKITMNPIKEAFIGGKAAANKPAAVKTPEKTDKITISSQEQKTDAQFIYALKNQIVNDLKSGMGADKLNELKMQVSAGSYDINPADVARRMLLV